MTGAKGEPLPADVNPTDHDPGEHPEHPEFEAPPRGVRTMAVVRWALIVVMAVIAVLSVLYSFGMLPSGSESASSTEYYCPMHPQVVQDHPGECPICSMSLVPKESGGRKGTSNSASDDPAHKGHRHDPSDPYYCPMHPEETGKDASARCPICKMKLESRSGSRPGGSSMGAESQGVPGLAPIELSAERVQMIGVRTAPASVEKLAPELRMVGVVSADESKLARVQPRFSGWVERLAVATTGQKVRRGQLLASVYNTELLPAQQEFLAARRWSPGAAPSSPAHAGSASALGGLEQDARTRLELLGMSRFEIDRIAQTGKPTRTVGVSAPISGHVVKKNIVQGSYVQPGTVLFEIADLSKVWVLADVYEYEIGRVNVGQGADVVVSAYPNDRFSGKVGFIYPTVDTNTRTLRVRLELENKELKLRPGMYGDVMIQLGAAEGLTVPAEALVDTGEHQYVFLAKQGGRYEPRRVRAGARSGDKVRILDGLAAGEVVVTTANFLIDSESRLRAATEGAPQSGASPAAPASACDKDFDKQKYPDKYDQCRNCERVHSGMGTMVDDCKKAIPRPWR